MKNKLSVKEYVFVASMLFGLFFGAGNLIFPVSMGQLSGQNAWICAVGFCLTGVGLPLLGIVSMAVSESNGLFDLCKRVNRPFAFFFTVALYLTIGPLFAIPRNATVAFQIGIYPLISEDLQTLLLLGFSFVFFALVLYFSLKPSEILVWVGKVLNPIFLVLLSVLFVFFIISPMGSFSSVKPSAEYASGAFFKGFIEGYNTMDVLAALAFGIILINVIKKQGVSEPYRISLCACKSGFLSSALMVLIYSMLTVIGASSVNVIGVSEDGGVALFNIASHYFGTFGGVFLGMVITVACLKTAIGLVTAISATFSELFPKSLSYRNYVILFSLASFGIANVGLSKIISYSIPVLCFLYPVAIVIIALSLLGKFIAGKRRIYEITMLFTLIAATLELIMSSLPGLFADGCALEALGSIYKALPLADVSMSWVLFAVTGFVLGCAAGVLKKA